MRLPTQEEYNVGLQKFQKLYAKINLVNSVGQDLGTWESVVIGNPTFTIDSTSSIRRTCNFTIAATNGRGLNAELKDGAQIWLDTYLQIYLGIEDMRTGEVIYTKMGKYMLENPHRVYSATDNTFTIKGIDMMCKLTGLRNGNLEGVKHTIEQGTNVRNAILGCLELANIKDYVVDECQYDVPNQINIDAGGTIYDILQELLNIDPNMQMYFDVDGVFRYEPIPTGDDEQIIIDTDYWDKSLISYSIDYDFDSVKNVIEVLGKTHDIKNFGEATLSNNTYSVDIPTIESYLDNIKVGFIAPSVINNPKININSLGVKDIKDELGNPAKFQTHFTEEGTTANSYQVIKYNEEKGYFIYLGEITPYGTAQDDNPESPFYVNGRLGKIRIVLEGGEYDNIYTSSQAQKRAEWELYRRCKLTDNIEITSVPVLWADVNCLIRISLPKGKDSNGNYIESETNTYMITSINTTFGVNGNQTIKASRYYPFYNDNKNKKHDHIWTIKSTETITYKGSQPYETRTIYRTIYKCPICNAEKIVEH